MNSPLWIGRAAWFLGWAIALWLMLRASADFHTEIGTLAPLIALALIGFAAHERDIALERNMRETIHAERVAALEAGNKKAPR